MKFFRWFSKTPKKKRKKHLVLTSQHHDLKAIYERVNKEYFEGKVAVPITWFGRVRRPKSRFRFGSYNLKTSIVKVHRMLDHPEVPEYCVAFILYHEMLHHVLPPLKHKQGKRHIHHPAFVLREKQFREYALAEDFLKSFVRRQVYGRS